MISIIVDYVIMALVLCCLPVSGISAQDNDRRIIDMHLHCYDKESYFVAPDLYGILSPGTEEQHFAKTYELMTRFNIVKGVICGNLRAVDTWIGRDADRRFIRGVLVFQPGEIDTLRFEGLVKDGKIEIFGEIAAVYEGFSLDHPGFEPYLRICEKYDVPVAVHTGGGPPNITYTCCPHFRLSKGDPLLLEDVLVEFPKLRIYMMHSGEVFYEEALRMMLQYPQLYSDLGVLLWVHPATKSYARDFLKKAKEFGMLDRVMFGSDQMVWPHGIEMSIAYLDSMEFLSDEDKSAILYDNAARFLKLDK
jgi:predicted TIM-barrel fold metal-dependent hydrolase